MHVFVCPMCQQKFHGEVTGSLACSGIGQKHEPTEIIRLQEAVFFPTGVPCGDVPEGMEAFVKGDVLTVRMVATEHGEDIWGHLILIRRKSGEVLRAKYAILQFKDAERVCEEMSGQGWFPRNLFVAYRTNPDGTIVTGLPTWLN
jgi:hypothetical protein